jgi:hypothetical protein
MADIWDDAQCSLVDIEDVSEELVASIIRVIFISLVMGAASSSKTSVSPRRHPFSYSSP